VTGAPDGEELRRIFDDARAQWPGIEVSFDRFVARLADGDLGGNSEKRSARARDLYLACACEDWNPVALTEFERHYLSVVGEAIAHIDRSSDFAEEVRQILRERILVGPAAKICKYRGDGALRGWVRIAAVRTALNLRREQGRDRLQVQSIPELAQLVDPELGVLEQRYRQEIQHALAGALDQLDHAERLLLRFYYVDQLTLSQIAVMHKVGISTVFRRLEAATSGVLARTCRDLRDRLQLSTESLDSLLRHVQISLCSSLSRLLHSPPKCDSPG
jgi:RNA polymerase sigma-70 factor (ECF subfamily)